MTFGEFLIHYNLPHTPDTFRIWLFYAYYTKG